MNQKSVADSKRQRRISEPDFMKKEMFWERQFWKRKNIKNKPMLGAIAPVGKDIHGRVLMLPVDFHTEKAKTGFFKRLRKWLSPRKKVKNYSMLAAEARKITMDYMEYVSERLAPYQRSHKTAS